MNRKTIALSFVIAAMSVFAALPAFAFTYLEQCNNSGIRWPHNEFLFYIASDTFSPGCAWER